MRFRMIQSCFYCFIESKKSKQMPDDCRSWWVDESYSWNHGNTCEMRNEREQACKLSWADANNRTKQIHDPHFEYSCKNIWWLFIQLYYSLFSLTIVDCYPHGVTRSPCVVPKEFPVICLDKFFQQPGPRYQPIFLKINRSHFLYTSDFFDSQLTKNSNHISIALLHPNPVKRPAQTPNTTRRYTLWMILQTSSGCCQWANHLCQHNASSP